MHVRASCTTSLLVHSEANAAEMAKLKRGSFLGDMYKVREIMIQRRKEKAEEEVHDESSEVEDAGNIF